MMELRPYQQEAVKAVEGEWDKGVRRTLLVLPTGTGKTIVFAQIAADAANGGGHVLVMAHRRELLSQAADKIHMTTGASCDMIGQDYTPEHAIAIGSVQGMQRESRLEQFPPDYFTTIIVDEAHHSLSQGYQRVLTHFDNADVLGVTATPDRGDMKNLGQYFESLAYEYTLPEAIKDGYLCRIEAEMIPLQIDLSSAKVQMGDFTDSSLGSAIEPYLESIAEEMAHCCPDRKTVVFLPLISTSQKFCDILNGKGFRAAEVNGNSPDREDILRDFENGKYNVLCNSMLLTEGWDCPSVDCVVVLRPTKVRSLYCQMVGRGTRLSPGKDHLLLLDFLWMSERHNLCHPASLICRKQDVADKMTQNMQPGVAIDIEDAAEQAERDVIEEREQTLAKQLAEMRHRKKKLVDPLQYAMSIQNENLTDYVPTFGWEADKPTDKQLKALENFGIMPDSVSSKGMASQLLSELSFRANLGLATAKQIRFLESRGFQHVGEWHKDDASRLIGWISQHGWAIPANVDPETYKPKGV